MAHRYRDDELTVDEYPLFKALNDCCGHCHLYFRGWADMLRRRCLDETSWLDNAPNMPVSKFMEEVKACVEGISSGMNLPQAIQAINRSWDYQFNNPLYRVLGRREEKLEQYRKLYGGR